jgi:hypothetical protein
MPIFSPPQGPDHLGFEVSSAVHLADHLLARMFSAGKSSVIVYIRTLMYAENCHGDQRGTNVSVNITLTLSKWTLVGTD